MGWRRRREDKGVSKGKGKGKSKEDEAAKAKAKAKEAGKETHVAVRRVADRVDDKSPRLGDEDNGRGPSEEGLGFGGELGELGEVEELGEGGHRRMDEGEAS
jgi:hypothetical protein